MEEEYRASGAGKVFKAPQPELTDEEKKQQIDMEKERYLQDPDQEDLSQQVNYSEKVPDDIIIEGIEEEKAKVGTFDKDMDAYRKAKNKDNLTDEDRIRILGDIAKNRLNNNWVSLSTLAFETFIGIGADVTTPALLGTPLAPLYYPINYGVGYYTNILGQWLRGEEIKQGRAHAAGAFQTIPLGTAAKGLKGIARATGKGAVGSVVGEQVAVGIDEKRVLTPEEVAYAGTFGGTFGGISKSALDNVDITGLRNTLNRLSKKRQVIVNPDGTLSIADDGIDGSKPLMSKGDVGSNINPIRSPEVPQQIRQALSQIGSRDGVYDHASHLVYKKGKVISSKESRNIVALFETDPMQYIRGKGGKILDFDSYSKTQTKKFWDLYGPELLKRGVKRRSIQLHHITSLQASIGLFDGIQWGSKEWYDLTSHLAKNFIATGNNPKNLMRITGDALVDKGTPHFLTHKFLDKKVGKQGELFFTTARVEAMKGDWATRLEMANDFSSIVKESEAIAVQTQKAWDLIYGISEEVPEKLVEFMSQLPANKDYQLPELRELAVEAITDMNLLPKNKKVKLPTQEAILKFIKDGKVRQKTIFDENPSELNRIMQESKPPVATPKRKYRKKKINPDQTKLNE